MNTHLTLSKVTIALLLLVAHAGVAEAQRVRTIPIRVESVPPGATVSLGTAEGQTLGTTPITSVRVPRGSQTLIFRLAGHQDERVEVEVRRWRQRVNAELRPLATIHVSAGNEAAAGALVRIDGEEAGTVPHRSLVRPGRHLIQVEREDHVTLSQWADVAGGQVLSLPVALQPERPRTGSLLVAADVSGAEVLLDGQPRGTTPALVENVPEGRHTIEVRAEGLPPHRETLVIQAGERALVNPTLRPAGPPTGTITIVASVPGALVTIDGEAAGASPVTRTDLTEGEHILEITADGHDPVQQPITIEAGRRRAIRVELTPTSARPGRILVDADVGSAVVLVDGEERGAPPVVIEGAAPGVHAVIVRAEGYQEYRATCDVAPAQDCALSARLEPVGTLVIVRANARGARLFIDGQERGPLPYEGPIQTGSHLLEVRADGFENHAEQVNLVASAEARVFEVELRAAGQITQTERDERAAGRARARSAAVTHGIGPLPEDMATVDVSLGWPHLLEVRLSVGILGLFEGGFAMRTFGRLTEFEGRVAYGFRPLRAFGLGAQARVGGGIGPDGVNTGFLLLEPMATLFFGDRGAFTLVLGFDFHTDRYDFGETDRHEEISGEGRQSQIRVRLGGTVDFVVTRRWNLFANLEGILGSTQTARRVLGDIYGFGNEDTELYFRLGGTYKF